MFSCRMNCIPIIGKWEKLLTSKGSVPLSHFFPAPGQYHHQ